MTAKNIFVLNGHPGGRSLSRLFSETYAEEAQAAGHTIRIQHLSDLDFDIDAEDGNYQDFKPLEPPVETFLQNLEWADHVVVAASLWWGGLPAKLKGLLDRALIPGRAFDTRNLNKIGMPTPILTGKTGRFIMTSDTPSFFLRWVYRNAVIR